MGKDGEGDNWRGNKNLNSERNFLIVNCEARVFDGLARERPRFGVVNFFGEVGRLVFVSQRCTTPLSSLMCDMYP